MSKEKAPAYQRYPADYLADVNVMAMTLEEEGMYNRLMDYCWRESYLPADISELASLCKGKEPTARVLKCFTLIDGAYRHKRLDEERVRQEEWREKSAKGGRHSAHKRKHPKDKTTEQGGATKCQADRLKGGASLLSSSSSSSSSSIKNLAAPQASPPGENPPVPPPKERPKDEAYERFATGFRTLRGIPYRTRNGKDGDFVQLALLRRQLQIGTRDVPQRWDIAIQNYLSSPLTAYTLADLCVRYDMFVLGEIDRFNRPKEQIKGENNRAKAGQNSGSYRMGEGKPEYVPKQRGLPDV